MGQRERRGSAEGAHKSLHLKTRSLAFVPSAMATPTLQDVLAAVPAVAQLVNEMTELAPGVPASQQNLGVLFACMQKDVNQEYPFPDGCLVMLDLDFKKKGVYQDLRVKVLGPCLPTRYDGQIWRHGRPCLSSETYKNTSEGLLQGFLFARQSLRQYSTEGVCPNCRSAELAHPPVRRLKAAGMPLCARCMVTTIMRPPPGAALSTPAKRARSSRE